MMRRCNKLLISIFCVIISMYSAYAATKTIIKPSGETTTIQTSRVPEESQEDLSVVKKNDLENKQVLDLEKPVQEISEDNQVELTKKTDNKTTKIDGTTTDGTTTDGTTTDGTADGTADGTVTDGTANGTVTEKKRNTDGTAPIATTQPKNLKPQINQKIITSDSQKNLVKTDSSDLMTKNTQLGREVNNLQTQVDVLANERSSQLFLYGVITALFSFGLGGLLVWSAFGRSRSRSRRRR